jgi:hypothetical protein
VKIQALARGHAARTALNDKTAAAVKIQALARGHAARTEVAQTRTESASALEIQRHYRGHAAQTVAAKRRAAEAVSDEMVGEVIENLLSELPKAAERETGTLAAVKIQVLARGKAVRTAAKAQAKQAAVVVAPDAQSAEAVQLPVEAKQAAVVVAPDAQSEAVPLLAGGASVASGSEEVKAPAVNDADQEAADLTQAPKKKTQSTHWAKISLGVGVLATTGAGIGLALAIQTNAITIPAMITAPSFFAHGLVSTLGAITSPWAAVGIGALGGLAVAGIMLVAWKIGSAIFATSKANDESVELRRSNTLPMLSGSVEPVVPSNSTGNDAVAERATGNDSGVVSGP